MNPLLDFAIQIEAAPSDELEPLGWEAAGALYGQPQVAVRELDFWLGGNPATSLDACRRLASAALPGATWELHSPVSRCQWFEALLYTPEQSYGRHETSCSAAWLAAMLRAKAADA